MPFSFNAIGCMLPSLRAAELEVAGSVMARVVVNAIVCPDCGRAYSLIVPVSATRLQIDVATTELLAQIRCTCGEHPPIIQSG